jgi:lipopolysaccharide export system permease protein
MNLRIQKLDVYIIKKFLGTFLFLLGIIIVIAVVFDFSEKVDDLVEREAPTKAIIFDYYLNFIPYFALLFSSLFTFIAVIFFTSQMAARTEIIAILSSGVSFRRMLYPYFIGAFILASSTYVLNNFIIPNANKVRLAFEDKYIHGKPKKFDERNIHRQVSPGVFVYMESYSTISDIGYRFSMEKFNNGELESKLNADYIRWDSTKSKWTINNYYVRTIDKGKETLTKGGQIDTTLSIYPKDFKRRMDKAVESMDYFELKDFIKLQKLHGEESVNFFMLEQYKRAAMPFSTFILTLIGVALSSRKVRGGIGMHIGLGLGLCFAYILFMEFSSQFAISGNMSPLLAAWLPNMVFLLIGLYLYRIAPK